MMTLDTMCGAVRKVKWSGVFSEVLNMYAGDGPVLSECPLHIEFEDEMGVDQGGVTGVQRRTRVHAPRSRS